MFKAIGIIITIIPTVYDQLGNEIRDTFRQDPVDK